MKLKVTKEAILDGLQKVQSVVNLRTTLPVLSNVLLKAESDRLWLTTTDLEVSVRTGVTAKIEEEGQSTLPARRVFSIFKELPAVEIDIDIDEKDVASVRAGASFFKIVGIAGEEFPPLPEFAGNRSYSLEQGLFKEMLRNTRYGASTDETRYILNGVLLSFKGEKLTVVATDGRRLALIEQEVEFPQSAEVDLVVPSKTVDELVKNLSDEGEVKIRASDTQIAFEFDSLLIISKLIDGTYPNFKQVIPAHCEERVAIEREALYTAVHRVSLLSNDKSNSVRMTFRDNRLEVTAVTPEVGEALETIPVKYAGKTVSIAFNPDFVLDPLRNIASDEIYLEMTDDLSPGVIKCDMKFLYVLMPMRVT